MGLLGFRCHFDPNGAFNKCVSGMVGATASSASTPTTSSTATASPAWGTLVRKIDLTGLLGIDLVVFVNVFCGGKA
jgi:predicted ATPase with chaperone activity